MEIAIGGYNGELYVVPLAAGGAASKLEGMPKSVSYFAYDQTRNWMAIGGADERIAVYDMATKNPVGTILLNSGPTRGLEFFTLVASNRRCLWACGSHGVCTIWDCASLEELFRKELKRPLTRGGGDHAPGAAHTMEVHAACLCPANPSFCCVAFGDGRVCVFDISNDHCREVIGPSPTRREAQWLQDGSMLAVLCQKEVVLVDIFREAPLIRISLPSPATTFVGCRDAIFFACRDNLIRAWRLLPDSMSAIEWVSLSVQVDDTGPARSRDSRFPRIKALALVDQPRRRGRKDQKNREQQNDKGRGAVSSMAVTPAVLLIAASDGTIQSYFLDAGLDETGIQVGPTVSPLFGLGFLLSGFGIAGSKRTIRLGSPAPPAIRHAMVGRSIRRGPWPLTCASLRRLRFVKKVGFQRSADRLGKKNGLQTGRLDPHNLLKILSATLDSIDA